MILSSSQLLRLVAPHLSPELVPPAVIEAIAGLAESLPCAFTWGMIELRLAADDERADFIVCAADWEGSRAALAEAFAGSISPERERAMFGAAGPMLRAWAAGGGRFADIPHLFLEYDEAAHGRRPPFVGFSTDPDARRFADAPPRSADDAIALAREGLTLVLGELDVPAFATWERCARLLPPDGWMCSTAPLAPRGLRDLRLDVMVPCHAVGAWLDAIDWPGDRRQLDLLLDLVGPGWHHNKLQLDLGATVGPMLGVLYRPLAASRDPRSWRRMLDRLHDLGCCAPGKGEAALDWIGMETVDLPDLRWPIAIQRDFDIKLTIYPGGRLEAKSYFAYHPSWSVL